MCNNKYIGNLEVNKFEGAKKNVAKFLGPIDRKSMQALEKQAFTKLSLKTDLSLMKFQCFGVSRPEGPEGSAREDPRT
jgi:hypothetical protein